MATETLGTPLSLSSSEILPSFSASRKVSARRAGPRTTATKATNNLKSFICESLCVDLGCQGRVQIWAGQSPPPTRMLTALGNELRPTKGAHLACASAFRDYT